MSPTWLIADYDQNKVFQVPSSVFLQNNAAFYGRLGAKQNLQHTYQCCVVAHILDMHVFKHFGYVQAQES